MAKFYLSEQLGDPVCMMKPQEYGTDVASSAATGGVPVREADGIYILTTFGDLTTDACTITFEYSSTGTASDGGSDSDVWNATDVVYAAKDSDSEMAVCAMDIDLRLKPNITDGAGKIFPVLNNTGGSVVAMIGIPYGLKYVPATNAVTVVKPSYSTQ